MRMRTSKASVAYVAVIPRDSEQHECGKRDGKARERRGQTWKEEEVSAMRGSEVIGGEWRDKSARSVHRV